LFIAILDGFKVINDNHGHDIGDRLLMGLASRMKDALNETDTLARIGGDEFVAIISNLPNANACTTILDRLLDAAALPVKIGDLILQVSASLGVTFYPQNEEVDADGLIRQADQAMYQAKLTGKNRYHFFDTVLDSTVKIHYESIDQIRNALNAKEFLLYFQPKVNMRTGQVIGAEALIRWQHPTKGLLLPRLFLPVIEDHPLAIDLGEWVIDTVLTQMEVWNSLGLKVPVSVNIGARQLQDSNFIDRLEKILAQHKIIDPSQLELEILETSALEDLSKSSLVIDSCRKLGVNLALDDFGTGYSSLTYLKHLQVALLKIDQTFVKDMLDDPENLAILDGVIGLASAFRRKVIAEGVETIEHGSMLLQLGCDLAQGYGVAHPMPAHDFPDWVQNWKSDPSWKNVPIINRADLPLLFSATEHRGWIKALEMYLKGERATSLPIDIHLCRFGIWMETEGVDIYGSYPIYKEIDSIHKKVHNKGEELSDLFKANRKEDALNGLPGLYKLRDELLDKLSELVALRNHNYI
jgi:diguanylate cyclase (GGDEF)-like protein